MHLNIKYLSSRLFFPSVQSILHKNYVPLLAFHVQEHHQNNEVNVSIFT